MAKAWIYRTTPIAHDGTLIALAGALKRSRMHLEPLDGIYERPVGDVGGQIALVGNAHAALAKYVAAMDLKVIAAIEFHAGDDWLRVSLS